MIVLLLSSAAIHRLPDQFVFDGRAHCIGIDRHHRNIILSDVQLLQLRVQMGWLHSSTFGAVDTVAVKDLFNPQAANLGKADAKFVTGTTVRVGKFPSPAGFL